MTWKTERGGQDKYEKGVGAEDKNREGKRRGEDETWQIFTIIT